MLTPEVTPFFDSRTSTVTYVVFDPQSRDAIVIDPVLDYDPSSSTTWTESADAVVAHLAEHGLTLRMVLETHAHADHLSGARYLKRAWPDVPVAIGARIGEVQALFKRIYALPESFPTDGRQFDRLLRDHEVVDVGTLCFEVMNTPGHTPADCSYRFGALAFVGDTVFMPDSGAGRCDFPGGSAADLYRSVHERLYVLPEDTRLFVAHDYQPGGRELQVFATVADHMANNVAIPAARTERDFVRWREARDATLSTPKLLFQSIQVNIDAGELPSADPSGRRFLKIPINAFQHDVEGELSLEDATPAECK
ncbi:MAG: glyoxylase-like metal-dependent hydrolase (beta-lactamase superfamily II) [Bradymonadia bacterium]|jgi:glyoxylase-like metal-dependent hydrolase (beta-lactamase superfamily II)